MAMMQMLLGSAGDTLSLSNQTITSVVASPATASTVYYLNNDGTIQREINGVVTGLGDWLVPGVNASNYEVFATLDSGSLTTGTTGSWLNLGTSRVWSLTNSSFGPQTTQITVQIRRTGTATILASATITFNAEVEA